MRNTNHDLTSTTLRACKHKYLNEVLYPLQDWCQDRCPFLSNDLSPFRLLVFPQLPESTKQQQQHYNSARSRTWQSSAIYVKNIESTNHVREYAFAKLSLMHGLGGASLQTRLSRASKASLLFCSLLPLLCSTFLELTTFSMAAIFAAVAGGAGLASLGLQLIECAVKLKAFYESVEKAPKSLNRISREIKTFALLLRQIDDTRARYGVADSELLAESVTLCVESTQEIMLFTSRLEAIMERCHAAGRIYSALRMPDVLDICAELERAKNSLMVAFQVFDHRTQVRMMDASQNFAIQQSLVLLKHGEAIAQIREDTSMLIQHTLSKQSRRIIDVEDENDELAPFASSSGYSETSVDLTAVTNKRVDRIFNRRKQYRFRIPSWFSNKVWEVMASRSKGRWELCLQTRRLQPEYSPVVAHYIAGRVGAVREMFMTGEASPYDVHGGLTPLEVRRLRLLMA